MERLENLFRRQAAALDGRMPQNSVAVITHVDPDTYDVRVAMQPSGQLSGWLPCGAVAVGGGLGVVSPPRVGDQVLVQPVQGDGESLVVTSRLYSLAAKPPVSAATEKAVQPGEVGIFCEGAFIHIAAGGVVHMRAAEFRTEGAWKHKGDVEIEGKLTASDVIKSLTDVVAKAVALLGHAHRGVRGGPDQSGPPVQ